jgi:hypothetical protein
VLVLVVVLDPVAEIKTEDEEEDDDENECPESRNCRLRGGLYDRSWRKLKLRR